MNTTVKRNYPYSEYERRFRQKEAVRRPGLLTAQSNIRHRVALPGVRTMDRLGRNGVLKLVEYITNRRISRVEQLGVEADYERQALARLQKWLEEAEAEAQEAGAVAGAVAGAGAGGSPEERPPEEPRMDEQTQSVPSEVERAAD